MQSPCYDLRYSVDSENGLTLGLRVGNAEVIQGIPVKCAVDHSGTSLWSFCFCSTAALQDPPVKGQCFTLSL